MKWISLLTNGSAALCVAAIPFWILGIPGVEGNYATGWKRGLSVLFCYPLFIVALRGGTLAVTHFAHPDPGQVAKWGDGLGLVGWLVAVGVMVQAFRTMGKS